MKAVVLNEPGSLILANVSSLREPKENEVLLKVNVTDSNEISTNIKADIFKSDFPGYGSRLAYGTSRLGGVWSNVHEQESIDCLPYALERGITSFDTTPPYSNTELFLGK